jgi:RNA polymerase sigma-70 factor (ECF subfamily)
MRGDTVSAQRLSRLSGKLVPFRREPAVPSAVLSDDTLVAECAAGVNGALAELFRRHGDRVRRVLARLRGVDRRDLDDLVQATFIEVYLSAPRFESRAAVGTWILSIAVNVMRHHVRGEARRRALKTAAERIDLQAASRPDEDAARRQLMARLESALAALPQDLQLAFTMCELEGIRGVDAARVLGMREGTLWRKLHEARCRLREALERGGAS